MTIYYHPDQLFDRGKLHHDYLLAVDDNVSSAILPLAAAPESAQIRRIKGVLSPGFVETQANGGGGVLFNDDFSAEGIKTILAAHRQYGTVAMLPTFITDTQEKYHQAIASVAQCVKNELPGLIGGHFEGPFLNVEKKGTHRPDYIRTPDEKDFACFAEHARYLQHSIVSLAPEQVPVGTVSRFVALGLTVHMAHSMATHDDLRLAYAEGLRGLTHLYNAMRPFSGRDPGPIGSAASLGLNAGIIADGVHSHPFAMESAYRLLGDQHLMLVTDSMHTIGTDIKEFILTGQKVFVREDRLVNEFGSLAGAHVTLLCCVENTMRHMKASLESALRMAITTPARHIKRDDLGTIVNRRLNDIICLHPGSELTLSENWHK